MHPSSVTRLIHALVWAVSFPAVGFCLWAFLFGLAVGIIKDGGPPRARLASDLEGFAVLTGMLLVLVLGSGGGIAGWLWPNTGTGWALRHLALALLGLASVTGVWLWILGVPHWTLV